MHYGISGLLCGSDALSHSIQCYTCGLSKNPFDSEMKGIYPHHKTYNHSCDEMMSTATNRKISSKFIRMCPPNSSGCFSATGQYDRGDRNPHNDISRFLQNLNLFKCLNYNFFYVVILENIFNFKPSRRVNVL